MNSAPVLDMGWAEIVFLYGISAMAILAPLRKYHRGLYNANGMWVYTTRGIGAGPIPQRINCPPKVTEITLCSLH